MLRALQIVKASGLPFSAHLVSGGPLLERHRELLKSLHLNDRITIHGVVPNVDEYLSHADIFVLPSREEQSGSLALIEAMRAGVACIASACDGIPEDVTHLSDAWLTTPGDHQSLAEAIIALLRDLLCERGSQMLDKIPSGSDFPEKRFLKPLRAYIEMRLATKYDDIY